MIECFYLKKPVGFLCNGLQTAYMKRVKVVLPVLTVLSLAVVLSGCGCGRSDKDGLSEVTPGADVANRLNDKNYMKSLNSHRDDQKVVARERNKLAQKMTACAERVKGGLAEDVSKEDFNAALEKDEEWQSLKKQQAVLDQDVLDVLREARETVRERIMKEEREAKAVSGG